MNRDPRQYALSDSAFAALAAGRPSTETVETLRRAAHGRHRMLQLLRGRTGEPPSDPLWGAAAAAFLRSGRPPAGSPSGRVLTATHHHRTIAVRLDDADPRRDLLGLPPTGRLPESEVAHWQACLDAAWRMLVTRHPRAAGTLAAVLRVIVPVVADPGAHGISATSADAFGAVAMSTPADGRELAVGLLHETQHSLLNVVTHLFPLCTDPRVLGYSPWRDDPRPAIGQLHGAYAYLAVVRFWRREQHAAGNPAGNLAAFEFARWRSAVVEAAERLLVADGLTPAGRRFVGAVKDEVEPWLRRPVPVAVQRLAAAANADHELRWRLRNHVVAPETVAALAAAWRAARPAGATPPPRLAPAPGRVLENSARLELIRAFLNGDHPLQPGTRATAGDVAFVRGDAGAAADAYRKDLSDDAAWTGFALATGDDDLTKNLEIVVALARELNEDPRDLARWISLRSVRPEAE